MAGRIDRGTMIATLGLLMFFTGGAGQRVAATTSTAPETIDWDSLRRPLDLPELAPGAPCPRTEGRRVSPHYSFGLGDGPAYPALGPDGVFNYGGGREQGGWFFSKVLWFASPDDDGPILVRGGQLNGPNEVRFDGGDDPQVELRLEDGGITVGAPGWRNWPSYTRVRAAGCYAYQIDGQDFSKVIVFQAVEERPGQLTPLPPWKNGPNPLPRGLVAASGVRLGADDVRLALVGAEGLMLRLDVAPTESSPIDLPDGIVQRLDTAAGTVRWVADPKQGWPHVATWDDGQRRYRLEVLDADPDAWSEADLVTLVEAFAEEAPSVGS